MHARSVADPSSVASASATLAAPTEEASTSTTVLGNSALDPPTYVTATGRIIASKQAMAFGPIVSHAVRTFLRPGCRPFNPVHAVGDLHGDLDKAVEALKLGRVISVSDEGEVSWVGGDTVVVQLGDVLDRGDVEIGE